MFSLLVVTCKLRNVTCLSDHCLCYSLCLEQTNTILFSTCLILNLLFKTELRKTFFFFFFLNLVLQAELEAFLPCFHRILWVSINAYGTMYWNHIFGSSSVSFWVSQGQGPYIINICIPKSTMLWGTPRTSTDL